MDAKLSKTSLPGFTKNNRGESCGLLPGPLRRTEDRGSEPSGHISGPRASPGARPAQPRSAAASPRPGARSFEAAAPSPHHRGLGRTKTPS